MRSFLNKNFYDVPKNIMPEIEALLDDSQEIISLAVGEPDFKTPWNICEEAIYRIEKGSTYYSEAGGLKQLRAGIKNYLAHRFDTHYNLDEILVTSGASEAIDLIMRTTLEKDDEVIVVEPSYVAYTPAIKASGGRVVGINTLEADDFKLTKDKLLKAITPKTKILLMNYPNNPTGGVMDKSDYEALIPIIKEHQLLVVADEIYAELTYGHQHCSIASFSAIKDQVILISGFSKAFSMTGWRLGYICGPKAIIEAMTMIHRYFAICASTISQFAGIEAINNSERAVENMRQEFLRRRNFIVNELNKMGLKTHFPKGAFYVFPSIDVTGMSDVDFAKKLAREYNLLVVPGSCYGQGGCGHIRISYAYSIEEIKKALDKLRQALNLT